MNVNLGGLIIARGRIELELCKNHIGMLDLAYQMSIQC
jgi:hypothetical protein